MNIMFLCHDLPNPSNPLTFRVFNFLKYSKKKYKHEITLVAFKEMKDELRYVYDLQRYCEVDIVEIPKYLSSFRERVAYTLKNMLSFRNIFSRNHTFLNFYWSPKMQRKIRELWKIKKFDVIFVDSYFMIPYIERLNIPKVIEVYDIESEAIYKGYKSEPWISRHSPIFSSKIYLWIQYHLTRNYERKYKKFDMCITVTERDKSTLKSYFPYLNISAISYGADVEYLKPMNLEEDFPSLIFVGNMATGSSTEAILYFYNEIYALIKKVLPNIKLYIVGKDPSQKILQLTSDTSVIITGYVEDVRPYLARASVVIEPITVAMGIRTRVLEALAMGKPVVATSSAVGGIDITPNEDIIIADNPNEFAERVIQLLNDEELRGRIGKNARKLVEKKYSWEIMSEKFHKVLISTTK